MFINDDAWLDVPAAARLQDVPELGEDGVLPLGSLLLAEGGERALLVGRVDLVLLADAHSFHAPVSAHIVCGLFISVLLNSLSTNGRIENNYVDTKVNNVACRLFRCRLQGSLPSCWCYRNPIFIHLESDTRLHTCALSLRANRHRISQKQILVSYFLPSVNVKLYKRLCRDYTTLKYFTKWKRTNRSA